jgi:two-component system osmolarity sensor histidine kinase EnvZ
MAISIYIFFDGHWSKTASKMVQGVASESSYLIDLVEDNQNEKYVQELSKQSLHHFELNLKYIPNVQLDLQQAQYSGRGQLIQNIFLQALSKRITQPHKVVIDTQEKWTQLHVQLSDGVLIITAPQNRLFSSTGHVFLLWLVGVTSVLLTVAILFMRNQIRPIRRLAVAAEWFGKGREVPFFKPEGAREVRAAAHAFMGMRDRINKQIQQRTLMLAGVSHDLRTPLTRMKLQAEMMPAGEDKEAMKSDIEEMERMINAYLQFTKGDGHEEMGSTDILALINQQKDVFARSDFVVDVTAQEHQNYNVFVRPIAFARCLGNIIANAQKHADKCWVSLSRHDDVLTIYIDDDGQGVERHKREDVFKPFYRVEESRNQKTGGVGLGLPIAQDIVLAHGGDISLDDSPHGGLRVVIKLPV